MRLARFGFLPLILLAVAFPAAGSTGPEIVVSSFPDPNERGWLDRGAWTKMAVLGLRPKERLDSCWWVSRIDAPRFSISAMRVLREPLVRACTIDTSHLETGLHTVTLGFVFEGVEHVRSHEVRIDLEPPEVAIIDPPSLALGEVRLEGAASDGMSAPASVRVRFRDTLGLHPATVVDAACADCGVPAGCGHRRFPDQCRTDAGWSLSTSLPPGQWIATPEAADLAGNESVGEWIHVLVL